MSLYIIVIMIVIHILHEMKRYKIQNSIYKIVVYNSDTFKLDIMSNDLLTIWNRLELFVNNISLCFETIKYAMKH